MVCGPLSSYTCFQGPHMHLQSCKWEFAHTLFYDFLSSSLFIFFFFKPAISLPEPVESADFFSLDVYRFVGGVHGHQAIVSLLSHVATADCRALPEWHWMTPFSAVSSSGRFLAIRASTRVCSASCGSHSLPEPALFLCETTICC